LLLLGKALAGSSAFGLSETFLVSVRLGLIGFWPKRDFLLLLGGLIGVRVSPVTWLLNFLLGLSLKCLAGS